MCLGGVCQDSIQVHLKAEQGPILVLTCDIGTGEETYSCFLTLEESRIRTAELHTGQYSNPEPRACRPEAALPALGRSAYMGRGNTPKKALTAEIFREKICTHSVAVLLLGLLTSRGSAADTRL